MHIDDDPCLNSIVAESILPLIPDRFVGSSTSFGTSVTDSNIPSSGVNDHTSANTDGVIIKGKSGGTFNASISSNSRYTVKGMEGTQVRNPSLVIIVYNNFTSVKPFNWILTRLSFSGD